MPMEFKASGQLTVRNPQNRVAIPLRLREIACCVLPLARPPVTAQSHRLGHAKPDGPVVTSEERIRALPIWRGAVTIAPLKGGLSNESWLVSDDAGRHVVRFGKDYPFHHVSREREAM